MVPGASSSPSTSSAAPARRTSAGTASATRSAARSRSSRAVWSGQTYAVSASRPSVVAASTGIASLPRRSTTEQARPRLEGASPPGALDDQVGVVGAVPPAGVVAVAVAVGAQVQPGRGADLDQPDREVPDTGRAAAGRRSSAVARPTSLVCGGRSSHSRTSSGARPAARGRQRRRPRAPRSRPRTGSTSPAPRPGARAPAGAPTRAAAGASADGPGSSSWPASTHARVVGRRRRRPGRRRTGPAARRTSASRGRRTPGLLRQASTSVHGQAPGTAQPCL